METGNYGSPFSGLGKYFPYEKGGPNKGRQHSFNIQFFALIERQFLVNPVRDVHEAVIVASGMSIVRRPLAATGIARSGIGSFALGKFTVFDHHIRGVDFNTIPVGVVSGLDVPADRDLASLTEILFSKLAALVESNAPDEIGALLLIPPSPPVNSKGIPRNCHGIFSLGIPDFRVCR